MMKQIADKYWSWKRKRAEKTLEDAYLRAGPKGSPPSADPAINAYYAKLREKPATLSPNQLAAMQVRDQTIARANAPATKGEYFVEEHPEAGAVLVTPTTPTVKVNITLPPMKGKDE